MTIAEIVLEKLRQLPPDMQKIVLDFLESLEHEAKTQSGDSPLSEEQRTPRKARSQAEMEAALRESIRQANAKQPLKATPPFSELVNEPVAESSSTSPRCADRSRDAFDQSAEKPLRSLEGLWEDFGIEISEEDIAKARREMWSNFPREIS